MADEPDQPTTINAIVDQVPKAYALLAGLKLDLFTALRDGPLTAGELARAVGGEPRRLGSLLSYLVAAGLLTASGDLFANAPEADRYLVRGRPGGLARFEWMWSELWSANATTAESIRAGRALANHDYAAMAPDELATVYRSFDGGARDAGAWLAETFDFSTCQTFLDAGGGSGGLSVALAERYPHLQATVADLPSVVPIAERFIREAGGTERVRTLGVDLLAQPLSGSYDAAALVHCVQVFGPEDAGRVVRHVGTALRPGGVLYLLGFALEDTRLGPEPGLWFNFMSIGFYDHGRANTLAEYRAWLEQAGFGEVEVRWGTPVAPIAFIARKSG